MVDITRILTADRTLVDVPAKSRKRAIELASDLLARDAPEITSRALFDGLMSRERLGSTGLGEGIAIPHCRMPCNAPLAALLRLEAPVDFDALDDQPVDLLFVLVVPPEETSAHLQTLAALAKLFQSAEHRAALRSAPSAADLYETFVGLLHTGGA